MIASETPRNTRLANEEAVERAQRRTRLIWKHERLLALPINEWGDFFVGAVAPLAFLWLALGYFQQGNELRQNTEALIAQERQLEKQAAATARLGHRYLVSRA